MFHKCETPAWKMKIILNQRVTGILVRKNSSEIIFPDQPRSHLETRDCNKDILVFVLKNHIFIQIEEKNIFFKENIRSELNQQKIEVLKNLTRIFFISILIFVSKHKIESKRFSFSSRKKLLL